MLLELGFYRLGRMGRSGPWLVDRGSQLRSNGVRVFDMALKGGCDGFESVGRSKPCRLGAGNEGSAAR